jgi:hypothetical protein
VISAQDQQLFTTPRLTHPADAEQIVFVAHGGDVWLTCVAAGGDGGNRVDWFKLNESRPVLQLSSVSARWSNVHIGNAQPEHDGTYECRVASSGEDSAGTRTRARYHVRVVAPTRVDLTVTATSDGEAVRVTCTVPAPTATVAAAPELFVDGRRIFHSLATLPIRRASLTGNPIEVEIDVTQSTELSVGVQCAAASAYNATGVARAQLMSGAVQSAYLMVGAGQDIRSASTDEEELMTVPVSIEAPVITTPPDNVTAVVGETVTMVCMVENAMIVEWYLGEFVLNIIHPHMCVI